MHVLALLVHRASPACGLTLLQHPVPQQTVLHIDRI